MSPEQIEGRDVDARTDIYSLGCVIFESLAGGLHSAGRPRSQSLGAYVTTHLPLTELRPDLPAELDAVIAKAMAKSPDERYGSCRELVADLRRTEWRPQKRTPAGRL